MTAPGIIGLGCHSLMHKVIMDYGQSQTLPCRLSRPWLREPSVLVRRMFKVDREMTETTQKNTAVGTSLPAPYHPPPPAKRGVRTTEGQSQISPGFPDYGSGNLASWFLEYIKSTGT